MTEVRKEGERLQAEIEETREALLCTGYATLSDSLAEMTDAVISKFEDQIEELKEEARALRDENKAHVFFDVTPRAVVLPATLRHLEEPLALLCGMVNTPAEAAAVAAAVLAALSTQRRTEA